jgi:hypothetical protein
MVDVLRAQPGGGDTGAIMAGGFERLGLEEVLATLPVALLEAK